MIRLGPFEMLQPLEEGGMGIVWRAVHIEQRVPVAVKVISERGLATPTARMAFRDEISAAARLHHPSIVMVFDHGEVTPEAAAASKGALGVGAAYVVMEYASFGSLKSRLGEMPWAQIRSTLMCLLDALAHAHARGVVHRDIKPGNILLAGPEDVRPGLKLADFGLARALDRTDEIETVKGTPLYMSSEQLNRRWRDFGPWTDLYALGHVAWELATGRAAYRGRTMPGILNGHLMGTLPPFQPRVDVPRGLHGWLMRMLQPDPKARFQRAADAAWALAQLGDADVTGSGGAIPGVITNPTLTLDDTLLMLATTNDVPLVLEEPGPTGDEHPPPTPLTVPPIPPSWRRQEPPPAPLHLLGVGLSLFGLRTVPLVARSAQRNALWRGLLDCRKANRPHFAALVGSAGNGKTRLVEWIAQRAHEVGGAHLMKAVHSPNPTPLDGLAPMISSWTRCMTLDREAIRERLTPELEPSQLEPLVELLSPAGPETHDGVRLASEEERFMVVLDVLQRAAVDRPVIVWLDDVQWGPDALRFASWLAERSPPLAVLVLMTAQSEGLAERTREQAALEHLLEHPNAILLPIGPLVPRDALELVRVLLGLEGELAHRLADRTGGNPLFTIQLVADWVARGVLVPGSGGFGLREGATVELPDTLHQVWATRLDRITESRATGTRRALEIAAALGQDIDAAEWVGICISAGVPVDQGLVEALQEARLAVATEVGWSFTHGMLRESLIRLAKQESRWTTANELCAVALSSTRPVPHARLGRHWLAAGDFGKASSHLLEALEVTHDEGPRDDRRSILAATEHALRQGQTPDTDPRWGALWLARAQHQLTSERLDEAYRDVVRVDQAARRHRWPHRARANLMLGQVAQMRGNILQAESLFGRAMPLVRKHQDPVLLADALVQMSHTRILNGNRDGARVCLAEALSLYEELEDLGGQAKVLRYEGDIARLESRYEEAKAIFIQVSEMNRRAGLRAGASSALHGVAEMDRLLGNVEAAEPVYRQVVQEDDARGKFAEVPRLNLALCLIARGRYAEATSRLTTLQDRWIANHKRGFAAIAHASLMHAAAGLQNWAAFDDHCHKASVLCPETGMVDLDLALAGEEASKLCEQAGQSSRAKEALEFALSQWESLGDEGRADAALTRLDTL